VNSEENGREIEEQNRSLTERQEEKIKATKMNTSAEGAIGTQQNEGNKIIEANDLILITSRT
jgi:hypothetical protein